MGIYLNIGNSGFQTARNSEYIDKSGLVSVVNKSVNTEMKFFCVTRCRRFGKAMAAKMLNAYYDKSCDSRHLFEDLQCYIPNKEVSMEMANAIEDTDWTQVINALQASDDLLQATIDGDEAAVAKGIENAHDENTSILAYNNENSLACVLTIAYYAARNFYIIHREFHSGKGFADLVMLPFKRLNRPAIVVELKYKQDADTAISQIKRKEYPAKIAQYIGEIVLVGINYDKATKQHTCKIERITK